MTFQSSANSQLAYQRSMPRHEADGRHPENHYIMSDNATKRYEITRIDIWKGFKQLLPISSFVVIFGLAFGLAAISSGLDNTSTVLMSALAFAGAAQFAVLDLWGTQVPLVPLIVTVFAVNARHLLMGATLYPWMHHLPPVPRYGAMLIVSDANWAMSMQAFARGQSGLGLLVGGGIALWLAWVIGSWLGIYFGGLIQTPEKWGLDMVMGCFLLAMVVGGKKNLRMFVIWVAAASASLLAYWYLPKNSHVVAGALAGGTLGAVWTEKKKCTSKHQQQAQR